MINRITRLKAKAFLGARQRYCAYKSVLNKFSSLVKEKKEKSFIFGASDVPLLYQSIGEKLEETAHSHPDSLCIASHHQKMQFTYSQFLQKVNDVAAALVALKLPRHSRIGIYSPNNIEWVIAQFAASAADFVLVNINPAYQLHELEYSLHKVALNALIMAKQHKASNYLEMLKTIVPEISHQNAMELNLSKLPNLKNVILIDDAKEKGFLNFKDLFSIHTPESHQERKRLLKSTDPDSYANIQFTSGTTSMPKAATLSHFNILNNGRFIGRSLHYNEKDIICLPVPMYHCFGMVLGMLAALNHSSGIVLPAPSFEVQPTLQCVQQYKCTALYGVPTMFIELLNEQDRNDNKYDMSTLSKGVMAGTLCPQKVMREVQSKLNMKKVQICYGMTETSPVSFQTDDNDSVEVRSTTVGRIQPHVQVKIVDQEGQVVPRGTPGEICTRGYSVMKKYYNDPDTTKQTIDEDGWLWTGDQGVLDENGYMRIVGRIKDMIIRGGENVSPKEIEDFLMEFPNVNNVQVVGVKDEKLGEECCAVIQRKDASKEISKNELLAFMKGRIAHFKIPKYVWFTQTLPFTVTGKPQKYKLREQIEDILLNRSEDNLKHYHLIEH